MILYFSFLLIYDPYPYLYYDPYLYYYPYLYFKSIVLLPSIILLPSLNCALIALLPVGYCLLLL